MTDGQGPPDDRPADDMASCMVQVEAEADDRFLAWAERQEELRWRLAERDRVLRRRLKVAVALNGTGFALTCLAIVVAFRDNPDGRYLTLAGQLLIVAALGTMLPIWLTDPIYRERRAFDHLLLASIACTILSLLNFAGGTTASLVGRPDLDAVLSVAGWAVLAIAMACLGIGWAVRPWRGRETGS
jgi:hypothetical protein